MAHTLVMNGWFFDPVRYRVFWMNRFCGFPLSVMPFEVCKDDDRGLLADG